PSRRPGHRRGRPRHGDSGLPTGAREVLSGGRPSGAGAAASCGVRGRVAGSGLGGDAACAGSPRRARPDAGERPAGGGSGRDDHRHQPAHDRGSRRTQVAHDRAQGGCPPVMVLYWLTWVTVRLLATVLFRFRVSGAHHVPKTGGVLIAANHTSYLDIPILGCGMPRRAWFMGRMDLFYGPAAWLMR